MVRAPCCDQNGLRKGPWSLEEDQILISYIQKHGHGNWRALPKQAGLLRCGKSCRLRWMNYLSPDIKRGNFTKEEEDNIIHLQEILGNRWSAIAARLPGRTDNEIKNIWHTHLKKRLKNYQPPQSFKRHSKKINQTNSLVHAPNSPQISSSEISTLTADSSSSILALDMTIGHNQIVVKLEEMNSSEYFTEIDESFWTEELVKVHAPNSPQISSSEMSILIADSSSSSIIAPDMTINHNQIVVKLEKMNSSQYITEIDESFWTEDQLVKDNNFDFVTTMDGEEFQSLDTFHSTTIMEDDMDFLFNFFIKAEDFSELPEL